MRVGITFDLRKQYLERGFTEEETAEFDSEATINFLEETIGALGHEVTRIGNIYELTNRLAAGERWDLVFNMAEGLYGRSREAQVPAILEAYNILYTFSDPLTLALSLDKAAAKSVMRDAGIPTPDFFLIKTLSDLDSLPGKLEYPLFIKPVAEGTGKGVTPESIVKGPGELKSHAAALLKRHKQPVLVETYLPGKEFTVGILGTDGKARAVGVLEVELLEKAEPLVYSYINKELCEERVLYKLVTDEETISRVLGIGPALLPGAGLPRCGARRSENGGGRETVLPRNKSACRPAPDPFRSAHRLLQGWDHLPGPHFRHHRFRNGAQDIAKRAA